MVALLDCGIVTGLRFASQGSHDAPASAPAACAPQFPPGVEHHVPAWWCGENPPGKKPPRPLSGRLLCIGYIGRFIG